MLVSRLMALSMASSFPIVAAPGGKQPIMQIRKLLRNRKAPRHAGPGAIDCCLSSAEIHALHGNRTSPSSGASQHPGPAPYGATATPSVRSRPAAAAAGGAPRPTSGKRACLQLQPAGRAHRPLFRGQPRGSSPPPADSAASYRHRSPDVRRVLVLGRRRRSSSSEARRHRPRIPVAGRGPRERAKTSRIDVAHTLATGGSMWRVLHLL